MENGLRTMNIASLSPDSIKEELTQRDIIKDLTRNEIHIAGIQETHIIQGRDYLLDNYRIIPAEATKRAETGAVQGGSAIMIQESIHQYITQITRQSSRVLRVTPDRYKSKMQIHILATYAPHNGHAAAERRHRWGEVKEYATRHAKDT